jgi:hypothetical protein
VAAPVIAGPPLTMEAPLTLLVALLLAADPVGSHQVSIPLDDYERLRRLGERPALTVVDLLRVEGSFEKHDLSVVLTGRASGGWPTAEVLAAEGARLHSCEGEALLSRAESGAFAVTPLAPRFSLRCKVALDGSDRLAAQATGAVLEVTSAVRDGELVSSGSGAGRAFSVIRRIAGSEPQELPPTVTGRYLVTLLPDEARFLYRLEVRNPARGHRRFEVALRAYEHVEGVDAQVPWDAEGGRYRFDLPPGETLLTLRGQLSEARFTPPVAASLQYLLLESHPLIRPDLHTAARRVGVGETGLAARFRGAQAFLLGGGKGAADEVAWTATRLEAEKTAGLALNRLDQVYFLGADGVARSESTLAIDNQGSPAFTLPGTARPTFASVGGEPAFLTHDKDGNLFLPLAQGPQEVVVQDAQAFGHRLGFGLAALELPRPGVPASRASVQLRYPAEWIPVYEELPPQSRLHLLDLDEVVALLVLLALAERLLALGGLARSRRWLLALALVLAAALSPGLRGAALSLLVLAWLALGAALLVVRLRGTQRILALAGSGVILLVAALATLSTLRGGGALPGGAPPRSEEYAVSNLRSKAATPLARQAPAAPAPAEGALEEDELAPAGAAGGTSGFEGLPARIEIPPGARQTVFTRELLATDAPRPAVVVLVAARLLAAVTGAALLLLLAALALLRRDLAAGGRALVGRVRAAGAAATSGA